MKKNFRNRMLAVTVAATSSFLLLSGFDSAMTVEDIVSNSQQTIASMNGMSVEFQGVADLSLDMTVADQTQSLAMSGNMDYTVQYTLDPFMVAVTGSMKGEAAALGMSGDVTMDMYLVGQEDGSGIIYACIPATGDDLWHAASIPAEDFTQVKDTVVSSLSGDLSQLSSQTGVDLAAMQSSIYGNMTVSPQPANVDGIECYEVVGAISGDTLAELISQVSSAIPQANIDESTMMMMQMLLAGVKVDITAHYATDNFAPVASKIDLGNSDFSSIAQVIGALMMSSSSSDSSNTPAISMTVNALNASVFCNEQTAPIEVPAEALAAEVEQSLSMSDIAGAATSAAGAAEIG